MKYSESQRNRLSASRSDQDETEKFTCLLMLGSTSMSAEVSYPGPGQNVAKTCSNDFHSKNMTSSCTEGLFLAVFDVAAILRSSCGESVVIGRSRLLTSAADKRNAARPLSLNDDIDEHLRLSIFLVKFNFVDRRQQHTVSAYPHSDCSRAHQSHAIHHDGPCRTHRWLER